ISGQFRLGDIRHNVADLGKVQSLLGYKPEIFFEEGLRRFIDWVRGERIQTDRYEESLAELKAKGLLK
ncbi:MAG: epimerase, partial [Cellvibrio sp.]|nr:epimerase [Cellvibrio sp.]